MEKMKESCEINKKKCRKYKEDERTRGKKLTQHNLPKKEQKSRKNIVSLK